LSLEFLDRNRQRRCDYTIFVNKFAIFDIFRHNIMFGRIIPVHCDSTVLYVFLTVCLNERTVNSTAN